MKINEIFSHPINIVGYHGTDADISAFKLKSPKRGIYFTSDQEYASDYGDTIYRCHITLNNPVIYSESESHGDMEIDRDVLISKGYDGRVIVYDDGQKDIIAFYPNQVRILNKI